MRRKTGKGAKTKAKPEFWAQIDSRCKPSTAAAKDDMRPVLQHGFISHEANGKSWLYTTDSYVMARTPITFPNTDPAEKRTIANREKLLPSGRPLTPAALKALDKSKLGRFRIIDDGKNLQLDGEEVLYPLADPDGVKPLPVAKMFKERLTQKPESLKAAAFNPKLLNNLTAALGATVDGHHGVRVLFLGHLKPIRVEPLTDTGAQGLLVPIRDVMGDE